MAKNQNDLQIDYNDQIIQVFDKFFEGTKAQISQIITHLENEDTEKFCSLDKQYKIKEKYIQRYIKDPNKDILIDYKDLKTLWTEYNNFKGTSREKEKWENFEYEVIKRQNTVKLYKRLLDEYIKKYNEEKELFESFVEKENIEIVLCNQTQDEIWRLLNSLVPKGIIDEERMLLKNMNLYFDTKDSQKLTKEDIPTLESIWNLFHNISKGYNLKVCKDTINIANRSIVKRRIFLRQEEVKNDLFYRACQKLPKTINNLITQLNDKTEELKKQNEKKTPQDKLLEKATKDYNKLYTERKKDSLMLFYIVAAVSLIIGAIIGISIYKMNAKSLITEDCNLKTIGDQVKTCYRQQIQKPFNEKTLIK